jgi:hypothetical protein
MFPQFFLRGCDFFVFPQKAALKIMSLDTKKSPSANLVTSSNGKLAASRGKARVRGWTFQLNAAKMIHCARENGHIPLFAVRPSRRNPPCLRDGEFVACIELQVQLTEQVPHRS